MRMGESGRTLLSTVKLEVTELPVLPLIWSCTVIFQLPILKYLWGRKMLISDQVILRNLNESDSNTSQD